MRWLVAVALVAAFAPPARADKAKAEQYYRAGAQAFKQQNFAAAAAQFELAYAELELPEIAFSAAQAYRKQYFVDGKPEALQRAIALYRAYLDHVKTGGRVADASDGLAEVVRELDRLGGLSKPAAPAPVATRLAVSVVIGEAQTALTELSALPATDTTGVTATVDGKPVELFVPIAVEAGDHAIEVTAPGYFPVSGRRRVVEGSTELVEVTLREQPAHLEIKTEPGAQVSIDGRAPTPELPAGKHLVTITARGREPLIREIVLARGESRTLDGALARTSQRRAVPWLLGGASVLAVLSAATATYAVIADGKLSSLEHTRTTVGITTAQLADERSWARRRDDTREAAWLLGAGAVAAGAVAAGLYWFDLPRPTEHTAIAPSATAHGAALVWLGAF